MTEYKPLTPSLRLDIDIVLISRLMTRATEKAINDLQQMKKWFSKFGQCLQIDMDLKSFDVAIKALVQQPCEDAISREAVLAMSDYVGETPTYSNPYTKLEEVVRVKDIMALQSVYPKPKVGHWIDDKCSVCGKGTEDLISSSEWYRNKEPNFCPFCGARLVESHVEGDE